jgi:hypothetical protein
VSQHATTQLIREPDLVGLGELVSKAVRKHYAAPFQGPLAPKSITALRAATRLGVANVSRAASALSTEELTTHVEATTA